ncbi:MAG: hypothetical protein HUJ70_02895 [Pseudobutyrivibrio sp.]|nr:hypothetical protein [Pseudobutyrivibrio sp.]MCF0185889.1 hypothetical protein [Bacteroidaceae bacterium]
MDSVLRAIDDWLHGKLVDGIMNNLSGMFSAVNDEVASIASDVATSPVDFAPGVFALIRNVSESVIVPIAGLILTFIACYELIQLVVERNNLANFETWIFFKWVFKTFVAVTLISNTFDIVMAVFDVAQHVISQAGGIIQGSTEVSEAQLMALRGSLEAMETTDLIGVWIQALIVRITLMLLSKVVFVIIYGRMIEIYLTTSLAPIPFSTFGNKEASHMGHNYFKSLAALGFQGFLIMIVVGIYAVLIQNISFGADVTGCIWAVMGYTILLCYTLFRTGSLAKSIFGAH